MAKMKSVFVGLLCLFFTVSVQAKDTVNLVVLHINDTHGHFSAYDLNGKRVGGVGRLSSLIKKVRAENPDQVLLLHAGDMFSRGEPVVIYTGGQVNLLAFEKMGFDAITPGNGEFYFGIENLQRQTARVSTPFVQSNVTYKNHNGSIFPPYVIKEVKGVKVGILGLGLIRTWHQSSQMLVLNDPVETAKKYVPELRPQVDFLIALTHIGAKNDSLLAGAVPELDLIVGGDSHTQFDQPSRIARSTGKGSVPIVQARHYYQYLGRVDVQLKKEKTGYRVTLVDGQLLSIHDRIESDPEIDALLAEYAKPLDEVIAKTEQALPNSRNEKSALGDLVGEAILRQTRADVVLLERNGNTHGFVAGDIPLGEIYRLRQYRAPIMLTRLSLSQIQAVLSVRNYQTAGCTFVREGKEIKDLTIHATPDSASTYLVALERQVAFRHFLRSAESDSVAFDFTGQRVDTAFERYLRDLKVVR
jgi:5'-nucleotidase/UDP-sugar diphosphatase